MVRRRLPFWIFYFDNIAGRRLRRMPAILISVVLNVAQPGAKPRVRAQQHGVGQQRSVTA